MYDYPLYRPPSESNSLIIQATLGCSHNKCSFCNMYKSKIFTIKSLEEIKKEIDYFRTIYKYVEKIFLADGDALIIPIGDLKSILEYIKNVFPECTRVTMYGSPKSILLKSIQELEELKKLGLYMIYMGIESGDDEVLLDINKGVSSKELIKATQKVKKSKITLSVTVIAGIGGKEKSINHAINTGKIISEIEPDYLGVLTLMLEKGTDLYNKILNKEFNVLNDKDILDEIKLLIENIGVSNHVIFRCNHASNYISLKGTFPIDKQRLLNEILYYQNTNNLKQEVFRRL
ncbi:radical SAM protein [Clostridium botulinum]|uniref:radical SAM protein n=1 Tax=Clostridium botulinum TaxID=1491 RepID=UPI00077426CE|nr:radical SAM protein [Clostridium botulinum]MBY6810101.1 radical SAM protein [Clostridium botulinum]MBY6823543.1 radical SAM protein [Clostridium botulinum]MBY6833961.1 radical SAM protein [Clostridium botulinum]MBY6972308.1 radical SAM protein [Clostridium botulinum]MCS6104896.1 radical SAM protein [Clostridium botulinum]